MIVFAAVGLALVCGFNLAGIFFQQRANRHKYQERRFHLMMIALLCRELERRGKTIYSSDGDLTMRQWALRHQGQAEQALARRIIF